MSTFTKNYNLIKPDDADYYDVQDFNDNMDTLDTTLATVEDNVATVNDKIGKSTDIGEETVFGKLNQLSNGNSEGLKTIKSIQRVTYQMPMSKTSGSVSINTVNPSNCIVIFERLADSESSHTTLMYSLNAKSISFTHEEYYSGTYIFGFWIIEFA